LSDSVSIAALSQLVWVGVTLVRLSMIKAWRSV